MKCGTTSVLESLTGKLNHPRVKEFFKSFVEKTEVYDDKVKMYYTVPVSPDSILGKIEGVLPLVHYGLKKREIYRK